MYDFFYFFDEKDLNIKHSSNTYCDNCNLNFNITSIKQYSRKDGGTFNKNNEKFESLNLCKHCSSLLTINERYLLFSIEDIWDRDLIYRGILYFYVKNYKLTRNLKNLKNLFNEVFIKKSTQKISSLIEFFELEDIENFNELNMIKFFKANYNFSDFDNFLQNGEGKNLIFLNPEFFYSKEDLYFSNIYNEIKNETSYFNKKTIGNLQIFNEKIDIEKVIIKENPNADLSRIQNSHHQRKAGGFGGRNEFPSRPSPHSSGDMPKNSNSNYNDYFANEDNEDIFSKNFNKKYANFSEDEDEDN